MALKGYFLDNESYSAGDVNNAFSYLTTEGVSLFSDTGTVIGDINDALASLTTGGVDIYNKDSCMVYKTGETYKVKKGVCFLNDGTFVVVDNDGYKIEITDGVLNYVYALHDNLKNTCAIYVSTDDVPENALLLAEVDAEGKITDKRIFSQAKVAVPTANVVIKKSVSLNFPYGTSHSYTNETKIFDIGFGGFNYVTTVYKGERYFVYVGDGKQKNFVDVTAGSTWIKKEGNTLVITSGTYDYNAGKTVDLELLLL